MSTDGCTSPGPTAQRPASSEATSGTWSAACGTAKIRRPGGFADELRVVLGGNTGTWGQLTVFREANRRYFSAADVQFASSIAGLIADGLRRSLLLGQAEAGSDDVGLLVLDAADGVTMANQAAQQWLDHLELGPRRGSRLPLVITAVARQARARSPIRIRVRLRRTPRAARARMRTGAGQWLCVRGSMLGEGSVAPTAVMIEPARAAELAPFIVEGYGFTDGERRVTELVAQGLPTKEFAGRLQVTAYTVQDHLKSIFASQALARAAISSPDCSSTITPGRSPRTRPTRASDPLGLSLGNPLHSTGLEHHCQVGDDHRTDLSEGCR